jgi:hypothetical protein
VSVAGDRVNATHADRMEETVSRIPTQRLVAATMGCAMSLAACGSADPATDAATDTRVATSATVAADTTEPSPTVASTDPLAPTSTEVAVDDSWRDDAAVLCTDVGSVMMGMAPPSSPDDVARYVRDHARVRDLVVAADIEYPAELTEDPYDVPSLVDAVDDYMTLALEQLEAGNVDGDEYSDTALGSADFVRDLTFQIGTVYTIAGVRCGLGDPARTAQAALNVPIFSAFQVSTGFDSVWVSDRANKQVHRVDPGTGEVVATIDVGAIPVRLQPADGRMVVRTADDYQFIDPALNTVVATLPKTEVGPAANRAWAVDGALWICDGQRLHRYDPTTLQPIAAIELGFDCGNVHATDDLVIPWTYNEDAGESGTSTAALVDPATNSVTGTIALPVDVGKPTVIGDNVFFPAIEGSTSVVIDRVSGAITSTPDIGRPYVHSSDSAYDGTHLYVIVEGRDIAVVDPATFEIVDTIKPMDLDPPLGVQVNALALGPDALWVVNDQSSILQRFDT